MHSMDIPSVDAVARGQYGLVTWHQLLAVWSPPQIETRVRRRLLLPLRPKVYRMAGVPISWEQDVLGTCLSYGATTVASYRSAARLWRLDAVPSVKVEVTVPPARSGRMPHVTTHRSLVPAGDATMRFDIPVTAIERTLIDLTAVVSADTLERALDDALRIGHTTVARLDRRLSAMPAGGRRRLETIRLLVAERRTDQPGANGWEDRIARWIVEAGLPPPRRQFWVVVNGTRRCLDAAYPGPRIAIEFDGWDSHRLRRHFDDDRVRTIDLQLAGWIVLPFTSRSTAADVVDKVGRALARRASAE
jgi:hypothetical protein